MRLQRHYKQLQICNLSSFSFKSIDTLYYIKHFFLLVNFCFLYCQRYQKRFINCKLSIYRHKHIYSLYCLICFSFAIKCCYRIKYIVNLSILCCFRFKYYCLSRYSISQINITLLRIIYYKQANVKRVSSKSYQRKQKNRSLCKRE